MHPKIKDIYQELATKYEMKGPFLEIGAGANLDSILSGCYFQGKPERFATTLSDKEIADEEGDTKIKFVRCNSQNMREVFADGQFATVLSNAVLEHDKYFWRSLDEMKRVLAPGGILVVGAPGYIQRSLLQDGIINEKVKSATATMDVHAAPDYWRFSRSAFKEVICEGLEFLEMRIFARVPTLIAVARMPQTGLMAPIPQEERRRVLDGEKAVKAQKREARAQRLETKLQQTASRQASDEAPETAPLASPKARKVNPEKAAKLKQREARLQAREARLLKRKAKEAPASPPEEPTTFEVKEAKLRERKGRVEARAAKVKASETRAEARPPAEPNPAEAAKPRAGKGKRPKTKGGKAA